jgi:hypothetical protein
MTLALISIQYPELAPDLHLHGLIVLFSYIVILKVENVLVPCCLLLYLEVEMIY